MLVQIDSDLCKETTSLLRPFFCVPKVVAIDTFNSVNVHVCSVFSKDGVFFFLCSSSPLDAPAPSYDGGADARNGCVLYSRKCQITAH